MKYCIKANGLMVVGKDNNPLLFNHWAAAWHYMQNLDYHDDEGPVVFTLESYLV